ncbi:hypothetical protein NMY22_g16903 [Coprinellus aureogranulatus]|nr:hypothetical protein NMY22_g16903 [Coprinellus aureogranulatus]
MVTYLVQGVLLFSVTWLLIKFSKRVFGKHPLDNLPGHFDEDTGAGHYDRVFSPDGWDFHHQLAATYGGVVKLRGAFGSKALFVYDPKALHHIVVKDQHIFEETDGFLIGHKVIFGEGLFATMGDQHRKQRKMLNPVFSVAHLRNMIPIFYDVTHKLCSTFGQKVSQGPQEIDVLNWMSRTALELIGQSGLGYSFDSLAEGTEDNHYTRGVKEFNEVCNRLSFARHYVLPVVYNIGTPKFRRWVVDKLPWKTLRDMRDIVDIMQATADDVVESKRKAMKEGDEAVAKQVGGGKDTISILLNANSKASQEDRLTEEEVVGQVSGLIFAAMDTTSNALSRTLFLLSHNPDVQEVLRGEIREAYRAGGGDRLEYDHLVTLPYLDAVCRETLRIHPPIPTNIRETRADVILPFSKPVRGKDGSEMTEVLVPKGTKIFPSLLASNRNPDIWGPDSLEWKPERWLQPLPESVVKAKIPGVYSHLMTFVGGGRACIGFKFSQLEMKVVLCALLNKFKFAPVTGKQIEWKMTGIVTPAVVGEAGSQMPLIALRQPLEEQGRARDCWVLQDQRLPQSIKECLEECTTEETRFPELTVGWVSLT